MRRIQIFIDDRGYTSWKFQDVASGEEIGERSPHLAQLDPVASRLFTKDVFDLDGATGHITPVSSPIRNTDAFAGVLQIDSNKTFGRTANKKRLLYKCIPDDKRMPAFLVPYDIKLGFSKALKNKYVVFRFDQWTQKHPQGILVETIGDVDSLDAFYEYQLYCKCLHVSLTEFTKNTQTVLCKKSTEDYVREIMNTPHYHLEDRRNDHVFTIDPKHSLDYDDGFSIERLGETGKLKISIYIANVFVWLETLGLWNSFSKRVATIYLPDRRRPMLPTILSDELCSLQAGHPRFAFVLDLIVNESDGQTESISFHNATICVSKNYGYEEAALLQNPVYQELLAITKKRDKCTKHSHDVVSYWMIQMNRYCAGYMTEQRTGVFRAVVTTESEGRGSDDDLAALDEDTRRVIQTWKHTSGQYVVFSETAILSHELMNISSYVHATSPIRRLVDLLNQMMLFSKVFSESTISDAAKEFIQTWLQRLDYINTSHRSIRKVQSDCELLCKCTQDPDILTTVHRGVVFDKLVKQTSPSIITYVVYIKSLKLLSRITTDQDVENYSDVHVRMYLFEDEDRVKRKIRLQIA
jgi:exoribonuclease R